MIKNSFLDITCSFRLADKRTHEEELDPKILESSLDSGTVVRGDGGLLYWNYVDHQRSAQLMTGRVISAEVIPSQNQEARVSAARGAVEVAPAAGEQPAELHHSGAEQVDELRPPLEWAVITGDDRRILQLDALRGDEGHEDDPISRAEYDARSVPLAGDGAHKQGPYPSLAERQRMGSGPNPDDEANSQ